jgi:hypothetical protein
MDKTHGSEIAAPKYPIPQKHEYYNQLIIEELEKWIRSMYLVPEEFEYQKHKLYQKVKQQVLEEYGW